jgi:hypothetical protein
MLAAVVEVLVDQAEKDGAATAEAVARVGYWETE